MKAAYECGITAIGRVDIISQERLKEAGANYVVNDFKNLPELISSID